MLKYRILTCTLALVSACSVLAQKDTTFIATGQETGQMAPQVFLSEYDRAFEVMQPARWMFKLDLAKSLNTIFDHPGVNLGVEYKLNPALSVGIDYEYSPVINTGTTVEVYAIPPHRLGGALRWYYNMKKRVESSKSASNFSGNYVTLESAWLQAGQNTITHPIFDIGARFGLQRRLLRFGYFDLSYGLRAQYTPASVYARQGWSYFSKPQLSIGLAAFSPHKRTTPFGTACDVLKCFQENRHLLKIDLYNLLEINSLSNRTNLFAIRPAISFEQKMGKLPLSAEVGISGTLGRQAFKSGNTGDIVYLSYGGQGSAALHWYFLQPRRILQGKSGNNLSGVFAGLHYRQNTYRNHVTFNEQKLKGNNGGSSLHGVLGIQHRITDRGFVQYKIGYGQAWSTNLAFQPDGSLTRVRSSPAWGLFSEFRAGLAF